MSPKHKLLTLLFVVLNVSIGLSQSVKNKEVQSIIDTTLRVMQNNAINAGKVDWATLKTYTYSQAANLNSPYELGNVMRNLYRTIDDDHGRFFYRDSIFSWQGNKTIIPESVKDEWNKRSGIKTEIIANSIGYLRVPSILGDGRADFDRKAQELNDSLCTILSKNVKGVVLDLRIDGGGAMFPMILGLKQLLGEGKLGEFQTKSKQDWQIKNDQFLLDTTVLAAITPRCIINAESIPCVLLVGAGTGSSGEFLVVAFKGRKKTILLGNKTMGAITSVSGFQATESGYINLATGYGKDRYGKSYTEAIMPDVVLEKPDLFNDIKNDEKVLTAIKWLNNQK